MLTLGENSHDGWEEERSFTVTRMFLFLGVIKFF